MVAISDSKSTILHKVYTYVVIEKVARSGLVAGHIVPVLMVSEHYQSRCVTVHV